MKNKVPKKNIIEDLSLKNIFSIYIRHRFLIGSLLLITLAGIAFNHFKSPKYKVRTRLDIQSAESSQVQSISAKLGGFYQGAYNFTDYPEKYLKILRTNNFFEKVGQSFLDNSEKNRFLPFLKEKPSFGRRLLSFTQPDQPTEMTAEKAGIIISRWAILKKSDVDNIDITVTTKDRALTVFIANLVTEAAKKEIVSYEIKEVDDAEYYLQLETREARNRLNLIEGYIVEFKKNRKLLSMSLASGEATSRTSHVKRELEMAEIAYRQNQLLIQKLTKLFEKRRSRTLANVDPTKSDTSQLKGGLIDRINKLKIENDYLLVKKDTLSSILDEILDSKDLYNEQKILDFKKQIELEYSLFEQLKRELFQNSIQRISVKNRIRILDRARLANIRANLSLPRKFVLGGVACMLLGGLFFFGWEFMFPRVKGRNDLDLLGVSYLGGIPDLIKHTGHLDTIRLKNAQTSADEAVICRFENDSLGATAFRYVRTRIMSLVDHSKEPLKVISMMSPSLGDGKSIVSANLAASFAHMGKRTLLIDCDFRKHTQTRIFGLQGRAGLSEVLIDQRKFGEVLSKAALPNLDFLPSGASNNRSTELLSDNKFADLISDLRNVYDIIILDTPAFEATPDSMLATRSADIPIIVSMIHKTTHAGLAQVMEALSTLHFTKAFGILNKVEDISQYLYVLPGSKKYARYYGYQHKNDRKESSL